MNREMPGRGLGVRWEGAIITADLYHSSSDKMKYIPVVVRPADSVYIPVPLRLTTWYEIGIIGQRDLESLLRHLLNQPAVIAEPIGPTVDLGLRNLSKTSADEMDPSEVALKTALAHAEEGDKEAAK